MTIRGAAPVSGYLRHESFLLARPDLPPAGSVSRSVPHRDLIGMLRLLRPSASAIAETSAVNVSPTCAVPLIVGAPVAGRLGRAATATVAALVIRVRALEAATIPVAVRAIARVTASMFIT